MMHEIWWSLPLTLIVFFLARKLAARFKFPLLNPLLVAMVVIIPFLLLTGISYLERIFETIDEPVVVKDRKDAVEMPPIHGDVAFDHVTFSYEPGVPILKDVSFHANQGQSFAVVGPTGAGKTTLVNLLSRFYNVDSGRILIDGVDIAGVTIRSLRKQMGVMMQDSFIFSGTIMDNIRYGNFSATDEEVIRAAKTVCAHDFIMEMENGYQTQVNERGSRLSAGQRQLISFARALLADPKILILDEVLSVGDAKFRKKSEKKIMSMFDSGVTVLFVSHSLEQVQRLCNKSMILEKGKLIAYGDIDPISEQYSKMIGG